MENSTEITLEDMQGIIFAMQLARGKFVSEEVFERVEGLHYRMRGMKHNGNKEPIMRLEIIDKEP